MCLKLNLIRSFPINRGKIFKGKDEIRAYKIVSVRSGYPRSSFRYSVIVDGEYKSDRETKFLTPKEVIQKQVYNGIHVYLSKKDIERDLASTERVIPVFCKKKHFVAIGTFGGKPNAVFTQVEIRKNHLDAIANERHELDTSSYKIGY